MRNVKEEAIIVFTIIALLVAMVVSLTIGPGLYPAITALVSALLITTPWIMRSKRNMDLPWMLVLVSASILLLHTWGIALYLYNNVWWWDKLTHLLATFVIAILAGLTIMSLDRWFPGFGIAPRLVPLFALGSTICLGVVWEMAEFFFDGALGITMQYSIHDTAQDLTIDVIGSVLAALFLNRYLDRVETASHRVFGPPRTGLAGER